jgi:hypothetical protein
MSRKTNNLKKRMRVQEESLAKRERGIAAAQTGIARDRQNLDRERREAEATIRAAALTIRIGGVDRSFGDVCACTVTFRPDMFKYDMIYRPNGPIGGYSDPMNISRHARVLSQDVAHRVERAIVEYIANGKIGAA